MYSSGTTAATTTASGTTTLVTLAPGQSYNRMIITNTGQYDGFFSVDGGSNWAYLPKTPTGATSQASSVEWVGPRTSQSPLIKGNGSNGLAGVYAFCDGVDWC